MAVTGLPCMGVLTKRTCFWVGEYLGRSKLIRIIIGRFQNWGGRRGVRNYNYWIVKRNLRFDSNYKSINRDSAFKVLLAEAQVYFFQWFIWNMLCLCHYGPALLGFRFQTNLGREKYRWGRPFLTMFTRWSRSTSNVYALIGQNWQVYSCGKFMPHPEIDSWSRQSFVSTCDVFNCLFPLGVQNEIQLISRFLYWIFGREMPRLSKSEIVFRIASFSGCARGL